MAGTASRLNTGPPGSRPSEKPAAGACGPPNGTPLRSRLPRWPRRRSLSALLVAFLWATDRAAETALPDGHGRVTGRCGIRGTLRCAWLLCRLAALCLAANHQARLGQPRIPALRRDPVPDHPAAHWQAPRHPVPRHPDPAARRPATGPRLAPRPSTSALGPPPVRHRAGRATAALLPAGPSDQRHGGSAPVRRPRAPRSYLGQDRHRHRGHHGRRDHRDRPDARDAATAVAAPGRAPARRRRWWWRTVRPASGGPPWPSGSRPAKSGRPPVSVLVHMVFACRSTAVQDPLTVRSPYGEFCGSGITYPPLESGVAMSSSTWTTAPSGECSGSRVQSE